MWNWLTPHIRRPQVSASAVQGHGHLTFGHSTVGRSVTRAGLLLKRQLWIWPIIAFVGLALIGYFLKSSIQKTMEENLATQLTTIRDLERGMLEEWFSVQEANATAIANDDRVREIVLELMNGVALSSNEVLAQPSQPSPSERLASELESDLHLHQFTGYIVVNREQRIIATDAEGLIGQTVPNHQRFLSRVFDGEPSVSTPFSSLTLLEDQLGRVRAGLPTMFACAPVRDQKLRVIAVIGLRIRPDLEFTEIMQKGKFGRTGETYAIDKRGVLISNSRFDSELIQLGLIPDHDDTASILNIQIRDPGGNMKEGFRPGKRRSELPLTRASASAIAGETGYSLAGYRDYRGVPNVTAWTWLPKYEVGVITRVDYAEAFRPLAILERAFFILFALLIVAAVVIFGYTLAMARMRREAQKAAVEAKLLGQYRLEEQIGAGGMGVVYRARHAMLRRPTAVKLLEVERATEAAIGRFEREVQMTCQLNNPHTVAIYDFGRTPEGVFYYAMEYLDGINLQTLVEKYGAQPEGRVIDILKQVCESLYEAHTLGLVHRDVKPANIMLNRRGGQPDLVKVLDFGLVKSLVESASRPSAETASGTPLYMSPEAIQSPDLTDVRSDLYAVGAVGYYLLTAQPVFQARSISELCQQQIDRTPDTPSQRLGRNVCPALEHAILGCLEKSRAKRPQTARDLAIALESITLQQSWTRADAEAWWSRHERNHKASSQLVTVEVPEAEVRSVATSGTVRADVDRTIVLQGNGNQERITQ
jgi:hypothetical protein